MARIFVIEDNDGLRDTICSYLELDNHSVSAFPRLRGLEDAVRMQQPDLLILDVMLPDGDGFLSARRIRSFSSVPIIFLTARTSESDRITGFEVGADDYLIKPFSNKELMLRVQAILRRSSAARTSGESVKNWTLRESENETEHILELEPAGHLCLHDSRQIQLTAAEWKILSYLAENGHVVISRDRLLGVCLDYLAEGSERTIDTHIKNIRSKLDRIPWIQTVRGFGYRFNGQEKQ
ncbi:response regulator transcription factor [Spirochaeta dissipatitropha]